MTTQLAREELSRAAPGRPSVVTIGKFDGVHRGHQHLVSVLLEHARKQELASVVITLHPNPITVLRPGTPITYLCSLEERVAHLHELSDEAGAALGRVLPRLCRAVMRATGATAYNVLQNNGAAANQAVFYVHFHIIPKFPDAGLGLSWVPGRLDENRARELVGEMKRVMSDE